MMDDMTPDFNRVEFACRCGCGLDSINLGIVERLQVCRDILQEPLIILSGCRCPEHNQKVGGASGSLHTAAGGMKAVDWTIKDKDKLRRFGIFLDDKWNGGWHYYPQQHFIHSDIGLKRRW